MDAERVAKALRDARAALYLHLSDDDAQAAIAPVLRAIADAEQDLRKSAAPQLSPADAAQANTGERVNELERKLEAQDEFASMLAHELRNLLAPLVMQAEYLLDAVRHASNGVLAADWLSVRLAAFCERLRKFVEVFNRIMDASRVTAGHMTLELEDIDLSEVVREVCAGFDREASAARSTLTVDVPPRLPGRWDRLRLEQICTNLLSNAIRYGAGRPIEVHVSADADWAELRVRDHGIGIAPSDQQRIFERFERAGQQRRTGGFGIGLWIVREICRALGGSVEVQSCAGEGSTFSVRLPRRLRTQHG